MSLGKKIRLRRLFDQESGRAVFVPLDDSLLAGPEDGLLNIGDLFREVVAAGPTAVMGFRGLFERYSGQATRTPCILNVTASTMRGAHTHKILVSRVEDAVQLGADAVAVHVNIGSRYEPEMLRNLGEIVREGERFGMPILALMYARGETNGIDENFENEKRDNPQAYMRRVRHAVRVGVELGADLIKTQYTGSAESFRSVIAASCEVPVFSAGGEKRDAQLALKDAAGAVDAGARGVAFGRNIYRRRQCGEFLKLLMRVVIRGEAPDTCLQTISHELIE